MKVCVRFEINSPKPFIRDRTFWSASNIAVTSGRLLSKESYQENFLETTAMSYYSTRRNSKRLPRALKWNWKVICSGLVWTAVTATVFFYNPFPQSLSYNAFPCYLSC
ncbi:hypothetical protein L596_014410 [Steinernema carpocapsae]|uniref:Uncharacterized protein n=1 Tax=Steinernema carpocapsae TaxID=34508 RepID=A0A4U5NCY1_STECR|nr:hypothetical protein L596_014410 [Steinernema carpocapsae]